MVARDPMSAAGVFSNAASREIGLTDQFRFAAYTEWLRTIQSDPDAAVDDIHDPCTFRLPYGDSHADVPVRTQPEGREYFSMRFTASPADDTPTPRQVSRWYFYDESRTRLGEAVLLDANI